MTYLSPPPHCTSPTLRNPTLGGTDATGAGGGPGPAGRREETAYWARAAGVISEDTVQVQHGWCKLVVQTGAGWMEGGAG